MRVICLVVLSLLATSALAEESVVYVCKGLEAFRMEGTHATDWTWGNIRAQQGSTAIGFSLGPSAPEIVPSKRPPGFRSYTIQHLGSVDLRYGFNVRRNQFEATLIGAPIYRKLNLVSRPADREILLQV